MGIANELVPIQFLIQIYDRNLTENQVKKQIEYQDDNIFRDMRIVGLYNDTITKNDYIKMTSLGDDFFFKKKSF